MSLGDLQIMGLNSGAQLYKGEINGWGSLSSLLSIFAFSMTLKKIYKCKLFSSVV